MVKTIFGFIFGNALWDWLVGIFGSSEAVVEACVTVLVIGLLIRYIKELLSLAILFFILWLLFG